MAAKLHRCLGRGRRICGIALLLCFGLLLNACDSGSSGSGVDPGIIEIPIAYIERPIPVDDMGNPVQADMREPRLFMSGGDVYLQTSSVTGGTATNLTSSITGGIGDVKGLNVSADGTRLIFSLRLFDPDPDNPPFPSWNVYEYDIENSALRRVIPSDLVAEEGDDLFPAYLPDGRIVFSSSRQQGAGATLIAEGKQKFSALDEDENVVALTLHVMTPFGADIRQISYNQSHDLRPQVLSNRFGGQVLFSRWDGADNGSEFNIYKSNPDGSDLELVYGSQSHATGTNNANIHFTGLREMENGDLMVIAKPFTGTFDGGDILIIDKDRFTDISNPIWSLGGTPGPGQYPATVNGTTTDGSISPGGRYSSAYPIWDGSDRILVSKSTCQVQVGTQVHPCIEPYISNPGAQEVSPLYTIWLYDMDDHTQKPLIPAKAGRVITEAIAARPRALQPIIFDKGPAELDPVWETENVGVINIDSVYDMGDTTFNGCFFNVCTPAPGINTVQDFADPGNATAAERPARFVRFLRPVGIPDPDDLVLVNPPDLDDDAFGRDRDFGMREILGYAPVEPDGSVKVKVPANTPLAIEVLDAEGRRIGPRHANWFQIQPGDTLNCVGCHDPTNGGQPPEAHARADAIAPTINAGMASFFYPNTLIPGTLSPNPYYGSQGQTMAEVRFDRVDDTLPTATPQPELTPDLIYDDYWTDPALGTPNTSYSYLYANLDPLVPAPLNAFCTPWRFNCRAIINYQQHIHPIWQVDRGANTCTNCHTTDVAGVAQVAAGQLDLTDGVSDQNADHFKSYRELLFIDQEEELVGVVLQDVVPAVDIDPTMTINGARLSYFIEKQTETELDAARTLSTIVTDPNYVDHSGMLTGDELKLIGEWLDLGAQNFNDPFDPTAPQN